MHKHGKEGLKKALLQSAALGGRSAPRGTALGAALGAHRGASGALLIADLAANDAIGKEMEALAGAVRASAR